MKLNASTVTTAVAIVTLLITIGSGMFYLGKLSNQVENLSERTDEAEEEMRRNNEQILHALAEHTHDADGNPVFRTPPGMEPTGANPIRPTSTQ